MCPASVARSAPLSTSHTFTVPSDDPDTASRPSAVTATAFTPSLCPASVARSAPLSTSHTFTVRSSDPDTASRPSAVTATAFTEPL